MSGELGTTNLLLGIMAVVSVFEALAIIALGVAGFSVYRKVMELVAGLETRQVAPAISLVNVILDDVRHVTATVRGATRPADRAIHTAIDRIGAAAQLLRGHVRENSGRVVCFI